LDHACTSSFVFANVLEISPPVSNAFPLTKQNSPYIDF